MVQSNVKLGFVESVYCLCTNLQSDSQQKFGSKSSIASQISMSIQCFYFATFKLSASYRKNVEWAVVGGIFVQTWPSNLQEKSVSLLKRPATHLYLLWYCGCPWSALIAYHQVIRMLICLLSHNKKNIFSRSNSKSKIVISIRPRRHFWTWNKKVARSFPYERNSIDF